MTLKYNASSSIIFLPLIIIVGMIILVQTPFFVSNKEVLSRALTVDLLFAVPFIHYLQIRKKNTSKYSVLTAFSICLILANFIVPDDQHELIGLVKQFVLPFAKVFVAVSFFLKIKKIRSNYKQLSLDLKGFELIKATCKSAFPDKFGEILSMEIAVLYFLFKKKRTQEYTENEYSYIDNKGTVEMVGAFIFIIALETGFAHILIHQWSPLLAYLSSYGSIYLILLFVSILKSRTYFPIILNPEEQTLDLRYGFVNQSEVKIRDIKLVERTFRSNTENLMKLSAFKGVERHNIIIHFHEVQTIRKVFGIQKEYHEIGIYVDDPDRFIMNLNQVMDGLYESEK